MTVEELNDILAKKPTDVVKGLQETSYPDLPKWSDLVKQYDPMQHNIQDTTLYPAKLNDANRDDFKRTSLGLQKLAVSRIAQSMFVTPVQRIYNYNRDNEIEQKAIDIIEEIYRTQNAIDGENIERCKRLNASCQMVTVWRVYESNNTVEGESSKYKLMHDTYSEIDGYTIYPINDPYGEILVVSIAYKDKDNKEYLDVYTNGETPAFYAYKKDSEWVLDEERSNTSLEVFPAVYAKIPEPVWGGDAGTNLVEQLEEMESYQGYYIVKNTVPAFTLDYGELPPGSKQATTEEASGDARRIIKVGKGGKMADVTWQGATEAINARYERLRNAYFEQIQVPDTSFSNMVKSNTSAANKELIFADAKAKAKDLGGEWEQLFYKELEIVKKFVSVIFPKYAGILESISVRSVIRPYSIRSKKENAEYVQTAGTAMSKATQVNVLGEVDDVSGEVDKINEENSANNNNLNF